MITGHVENHEETETLRLRLAKAEDMLGFRANVGLQEGLQRLVTWWRENRHNIQ